MKITHCIASIDETTGGPARSSTYLVNELLRKNAINTINLFSLKSNNPVALSPLNKEKGSFQFFSSTILDYSTKLSEALKKEKVDLFHGHGIWNLPIHQMAHEAKNRNIPYLISIRGMLEPWSMGQSKWKKKLAMVLYQHDDLLKAACLHATAQMEVESIRNLGYTNPIANIPNGIDLSEYPLKNYPLSKEKKKILFLSRIHPKKGIEYLINVWEKMDKKIRNNWEIDIAGNGDTDYIKRLSNLIKEKSLQNEIKIIGSKFGTEKTGTYHSADLFVLPTHSENFGIVIAEALACGVPVITTKGTPWEELESHNAGKWIDIGENSLKLALEDLMSKTDEERQLMGENGRKLIEKNYSIESVANKMLLLYSWILNGGQKPDFVDNYYGENKN